jgi:hypothetical protein
MILCLGDSNLRRTLDVYKEQLEEDLEEEIIYEQVTNNESLKLSLEAQRESQPTIVYISTILNEIVAKMGRSKVIKEDTINSIVAEQNTIINQAANLNTGSLYLICNPMVRKEPAWIEGKLMLIKYYMNENLKIYSPENVVIVSEPQIIGEDLEGDNIHLNDSGKKKMFDKITTDFTLAMEEVEKFKESMMEWDNVERLSQKTPKTNKKRPRSTEDEEATGSKKRKEKEDESVISTLKSFMEEIREERQIMAKQSSETKEKITVLEKDVRIIKLDKKAELSFSASVREDLDVLENENLRHIVIIKKMKQIGKFSTDKTEAAKTIQSISKELASELLGEDDTTVYSTLLFTGKDGIKVKDNKIPPFKIVFKSKELGIRFKEEAVKKSKDETHKLHKAYLANQQSPATRVRSILMWAVADSIKDINKGIDSWVNQNLNKPTLQVKGEEKYQRGYSFVSAMHKYGRKVTGKPLEEARKLAAKFYPGQLERMFVILKD